MFYELYQVSRPIVLARENILVYAVSLKNSVFLCF